MICANCIALAVYTPYPLGDTDFKNQILVRFRFSLFSTSTRVPGGLETKNLCSTFRLLRGGHKKAASGFRISVEGVIVYIRHSGNSES